MTAAIAERPKTRRRTVITMGEFVGLISVTPICRSEKWIKKFRDANSDLAWELFCSFPVSVVHVEDLARGISLVISEQLGKIEIFWGRKKCWDEVFENGHAFMKEVHQKARMCGINIALSRIDCINRFYGTPEPA